jgi:glycosyltransferase involved in cell wall biosynthesis
VRVALSLLTLVPGVMGGSETYTRQLAIELEKRQGIDLSVIVPANASEFHSGDSQVVVGTVRTGPSNWARMRGILFAAVHGEAIRAVSRADVVHFPFTIPSPRPRRDQPFVMTVHDLQHRDHPENFSGLERVFRYFAYDRPARKSALIITISQFAKAGIIHHLHIAPERIRVIPLGVDCTSFVPNLGERENFVLYPARAWKYKNHEALVSAMRLVRLRHPGMKLVLTGEGLSALEAMPEWVDVRGLVSEEELHELYRRASVLAFPSLYEGFGLPPLEAMASGCPVAASYAGSLPEVCGNAAVLFDPEQPADIARGIEEAISRRSELVELGLERVQEFTWERCAAAHEEAFREAAGLGKGTHAAAISAEQSR